MDLNAPIKEDPNIVDHRDVRFGKIMAGERKEKKTLQVIEHIKRLTMHRPKLRKSVLADMRRIKTLCNWLERYLKE